VQVLYATDVHGNRRAYEQLFQAAAERGVQAVVLGGDLLPKKGFIRDPITEQRQFVSRVLAPQLEALRAAAPACEVLLILGNDDTRTAVPVLEELEQGGLLRHLHGREHVVAGQRWCGWANTPLSPFGLKDWERFDTPDQVVPVQLGKPIVTGVDGRTEITIEGDVRGWPTLAAELEQLGSTCEAPGETIFVVHSPPWHTHLDLTGRGEHVGSRSLLAFIKRHQPPLTLHGHIHESPARTGFIAQRLGATVAINPGASEQALCALAFDTDAPLATLEPVGPAWERPEQARALEASRES
jgi:Icc-related predicted phosphoesterase